MCMSVSSFFTELIKRNIWNLSSNQPYFQKSSVNQLELILDYALDITQYCLS